MSAASPQVHPDLEPIAWLVGTWEGTGAMVWPGEPDRTYVAEITFTSDGRPFLGYTSRTWLLAEDGTRGEPGPAEAGFWRMGPGPRDLEVVLCDAAGSVQVLVGEVAFSRIQLTSDLVARTQAGESALTGARRLYGGVEGDLAYVVEEARAGGSAGEAADTSLQPHLSARLQPGEKAQ